MGLGKGKFYDARLTRQFCDGMNDSSIKYKGFADETYQAYDEFDKNELFHGTAATALKMFVLGGTGKMLTEITDIHKQMVDDQNYLISSFEAIVDPSPIARIEHDTLEVIDTDFKGYSNAFNTLATETESIVNRLNAEFGGYDHFPIPDSKGAKNGFITMCGGDGNGGFLKGCIEKLLTFDSEVTTHLKGRDTVDKDENIVNRIAASKASMAASQAPNIAMGLSLVKGVNIPTTGLPQVHIDPKVIVDICIKAGVTAKELWDFIIKRHIPQDWSNQKLLIVLYLLSQGRAISLIGSAIHLKNNKTEIPKVYTPGTFIENQYAWTDVMYGTPIWEGSGNMAYSGCEIIAVVNAFHAMGKDLSTDEVAELIEHFEGRGATLYGTFGTSPTVILEYLTAQGYDTQVCQSEDYAEIQRIADTSDTLIVTVYNNEDDLTRMIHTVNVEKITQSDGTVVYAVHNAGDPTKTYATAEEAIESIGDNGKTGVIQVIGVSEPTP